ncbi:LamG domain-containing protein [Shewanella sp. OMA3-2]|uniref:LamG domain-containing protein n=1 Tax=Shewanella sp. OMA3-2 TaxID=2908650 RepID=UPI001F48B2C8|nr:LamG domain-containing protein [Shewanella sp. OMA3-2]UJF21172.1 LamG domain-containing protein [Shewanella sp. OMA3-2]
MKHLLMKTSIIFSFLLMLTACGGGDVETNPPKTQDPQSDVYTGPAAATEDIQKYKVSLWDNISTQDKCGACHTEGKQAPYFASRNNVNDAYAATHPLVDLSEPQKSRLADKVAGGHNCWLASDAACGETMTQWIKLWADDRVSTANTIELTAPVIREPGTSKSFPDDSSLFSQHVYPIVNQYCSQCHDQSAPLAQSPFFASNDVAQAYEAAKRVINLDEPAQSRLVVRLGSEFHNCWDNCQANSIEMRDAITALSDAIPLDVISADMVVSKSLRLTDGITASSGGRFETGVIALYQFKTGEGNIAYDTSGISPAANLSLSGDIEWLGSWGLSFNNGKAQASTTNSKKLHDLMTATGEFSIEAWVTPSNVVQQGPARIVTYSAGDNERNFTLGQTQYNYDFMLRTESSSANGEPALSTPDAAEVLQATLQHVVMTYKANEGRKIYVNGRLINVIDEDIAPLANWDDSFALILGREASNQHVWQGDIRLLALYNRVLEPAQVLQNYDVGVGEKFFLLFAISHLIDLPNTYVMFEVSQFDNYSYLFSGASLVNIDGVPVGDGFPLKGLRLGINGKESPNGQAYMNLDLTIEAGQEIAEPFSISSLGTLVALEKGASQDEFFLTFEKLGEHENVVIPGVIIFPEEVPATTQSAQIGMRNFAEINHTMSVLTGVDPKSSKVFNTYQLVKRQLPSIENIETFISAQQMGITQMAIAYCDTAITDNVIRSAWFPNVDFSSPPSVALSSAERSKLLSPLITQLMPLNLANQPNTVGVYNELDNLVSNLSVCATNCDAERTQTIAKASCTAVLASAVMLVQ